MNFESNRLETFSNWPSTAPVDAIRLAKAGFYYTGQGLEVQCFCCGGKVSDWSYGDQVMARHRRLDPNCLFVMCPQTSGNIVLELSGHNYRNLVQNMPLQDYGLTEVDQLYRNDALRLLSFALWDDTSVPRELLVSAGFYHAGEGRLRCAWCGGELAPTRQLASLGTPTQIHSRYFPGCRFITMLVARENAEAGRPSPLPPRVRPLSLTPPVSGFFGDTPSEGAAHNAQVLAATSSTWRALGVVAGARGARHPTRATLAARLGTYTNWPAKQQTPQEMADAGFFYTGKDDQVCCFYCGGGLAKWDSGDVPWREHARWFPHCGYVLLMKGKEFVDCWRDNPEQRNVAADPRSGPTISAPEERPTFTVTEAEISLAMETSAVLAALGAGLDAARVRRAVKRRLTTTGTMFSSAEALIDAVLDGQLGEEAWPVPPPPPPDRLNGLDILNAVRLTQNMHPSPSPHYSPPRSPEQTEPAPPPPPPPPQPTVAPPPEPNTSESKEDPSPTEEKVKTESEQKQLSLEEENRQLKEARLCKVCMDNEVCVVFLPCGHLAACAGCGGSLPACPLCRAHVRALVRTYLA